MSPKASTQRGLERDKNYCVTSYGGAQQKLFPPAYFGVAYMRTYASHMHDMQLGIFRI